MSRRREYLSEVLRGQHSTFTTFYDKLWVDTRLIKDDELVLLYAVPGFSAELAELDAVIVLISLPRDVIPIIVITIKTRIEVH